ncbi:MAG: ATPase, partial [Acetivibrio sp.]
MIEKMKYLNITGPKDDIDRVVDIYLNKHEIHLENALTELGSDQDVKPFIEMNPYKELLNKSQMLVDRLSKDIPCAQHEMSASEASEIINKSYSLMDKLVEKHQDIKEEKKHLTTLINQIEPFRMLDFELDKIQHFNFIRFRFGRIAHEYYNKFTRFVYDNLNTVFYECERNAEYVWGVYFSPATASDQVDAVYASLHFERIELANEYEGTPEEAYQVLVKRMHKVRAKGKEIKNKIKKKLDEQGSEILLAFQTLQRLSDNFDIRKMAVCTDNPHTDQVFYILCGWMSAKDTKALIKE